MRRRSLGLVMADVFEHQPTARFEIAERTGLARTSLTALVGDLVESGLLVERSSPGDGRRGRPPAPLSVGGAHIGVVAVRVGADALVADATDLALRPLYSEQVAHRGHGVSAVEIAAAVAAMITRAELALSRRSTRLHRILIVIDAPLIGDPPMVMKSIDLGWIDEVDLVSLVAIRLPGQRDRLYLVNDANMAALEEYRCLRDNVGGQVRDVVYLKSDTGVGGAVIRRGVVDAGANGIGFEPGHLQVNSAGTPCVCGRNGCLAVESGLDAVLERAGLGSVAANGGVEPAIQRLCAKVARADPAVLASLRYAGRALSAAVVDLYVLFDPSRIVLGGYWADVFDELGVDDPPDSLTSPRLRALRSAEMPAAPRFVLPGRAGPGAAKDGAIRHAIRGLISDPTILVGKSQPA